VSTHRQPDEIVGVAHRKSLVRLAVSGHLAITANRLALSTELVCKSVLAGYREGLEAGGKPFILEEDHKWLREVATGELRDPVHFWGKMNALPTFRGEIPRGARKALEAFLPERGLIYRVAHRVSGMGSLGRERYVAIADMGGGRIAREAKATAPSACVWIKEGKGSKKIFCEDIITHAVRVLDPFVHLRGKWIVRRLAPHCSRIELATLPEKRDEQRLLHAMGFETANIHLGSRQTIKAIRRDLSKRKADWLLVAVHEMTKAVLKDWEEWKEASE